MGTSEGRKIRFFKEGSSASKSCRLLKVLGLLRPIRAVESEFGEGVRGTSRQGTLEGTK